MKFAALRTIAFLIKISCAAWALIGLISGIVAAIGVIDWLGVISGGSIMLAYFVQLLLSCVFMWAGAELILVVLAIEANTRNAAPAAASPKPRIGTPPVPDFDGFDEGDDADDEFAPSEVNQREPIRAISETRKLRCSCGVTLGVPAGKTSGKCPKCGKSLRL